MKKYSTQIAISTISFLIVTCIGYFIFDTTKLAASNKLSIVVLSERHDNISKNLGEFITEQKMASKEIINKLDSLNIYVLKNVKEER